MCLLRFPADISGRDNSVQRRGGVHHHLLPDLSHGGGDYAQQHVHALRPHERTAQRL